MPPGPIPVTSWHTGVRRPRPFREGGRNRNGSCPKSKLNFTLEDVMNWLPMLAVVLIVIWVAAEVLGWVLGAALHLLWIGALILLAFWLFQKMRANV